MVFKHNIFYHDITFIWQDNNSNILFIRNPLALEHTRKYMT